MAFLMGEAYDYNDFLWQLRGLALNFPQLSKTDAFDASDLGVTVTGSGNGVLHAAALTASVTLEQITLTCTTGGGDGVAVFGVSGATTGTFTTGTLTAGQRYVSNGVSLILRTTSNWSISDTVRITFIAGVLSTEAWIEDRWRNYDTEISFSTTAAPTEDVNGDFRTDWNLHGPGVSGGQGIYASMTSFYDFGTSRYNVAIRGNTGFVGSSNFDAQPGAQTNACFIHLVQNPMTFAIMVNGDRLMGWVKASGTYESFYVGFGDLLGTPSQHPYPMVVGGTSGLFSLNAGDVSADHSAFYDGSKDAATYYPCWHRRLDGQWVNVGNRTDGSGRLWTSARTAWFTPYAGEATASPTGAVSMGDWTNLMQVLGPAPGTEYELLPVELHTTSPTRDNILELEGLACVSGFNNLAQNIITVGSDKWVVVQNCFRTEDRSYAAMKLE